MSEARTSDWRPVSAWAGVLTDQSRGGRDDVSPGLTITLIDHADMATLICAEGQDQRFAEEVKALWNLDVPKNGRTTSSPAGTLVWSAPGQYLAIPSVHDVDALMAGFAGVAAASDQGDGRALVEISGAAARSVLAKGIAIDLDPTVFSSGCVAATALSHTSVQVWQTNESPTYVLSVPRTVAGHVWHWLCESAAEFGYEVRQRPSL